MSCLHIYILSTFSTSSLYYLMLQPESFGSSVCQQQQKLKNALLTTRHWTVKTCVTQRGATAKAGETRKAKHHYSQSKNSLTFTREFWSKSEIKKFVFQLIADLDTVACSLNVAIRILIWNIKASTLMQDIKLSNKGTARCKISLKYYWMFNYLLLKKPNSCLSPSFPFSFEVTFLLT